MALPADPIVLAVGAHTFVRPHGSDHGGTDALARASGRGEVRRTSQQQIRNSYSLQCPEPGCEMRVVDSTSKAPLVMIGEPIQAAAPADPHRGAQEAEVAELICGCAPPGQ